SSLTAVDLSGLTRIELTFAIALAAGAAGLMLALGFVDRRRDFAILTAIGATRRQLGAFLWSEAIVVFVSGALFGIVSGVVTAWILVKLLTGVFDPAPDALSFPWAYLALVLAAAGLSVAAAVKLTELRSARTIAESLHEL
ncbi:FtsX-like permease family protein, partial [Rhizobiaceae sp. 2RAB30]